MKGWLRLWVVISAIGLVGAAIHSRAWYIESFVYVDTELCPRLSQPGWSPTVRYSSREDCDDKLMHGAVRDAVFGAAFIAGSISAATGLLLAAIAWVVRGFGRKRGRSSKAAE